VRIEGPRVSRSSSTRESHVSGRSSSRPSRTAARPPPYGVSARRPAGFVVAGRLDRRPVASLVGEGGAARPVLWSTAPSPAVHRATSGGKS